MGLDTTQPDTATLIAAIEAGLTEGLSFYGAMTGYSSPEITAARAAFRALVTDYERQRSENERLRAFVEEDVLPFLENVSILEQRNDEGEMIDIWPPKEAKVLQQKARALLASMPADGESEEAKK